MESIKDLHALGDLLTEFISDKDKDLKRKRIEPKFSYPVAKKVCRTVHSMDFSAYLERVSTFKDSSWCHPSCSKTTSPLSPLQLARHGWVAVKEEIRLARCISCKENLFLLLPDMTSLTFKTMLEKQSARVITGHSEFCPWGASPSPENWTSIQCDKMEIISKAEDLFGFGTELPCIEENIMLKFTSVIDSLVKDVDKNEARRSEKRGTRKSKDNEKKSFVRRTAALLASLGWQKGIVENTIVDTYNVRRIGLWNFVSIQEVLDKEEDLKVAREISGNSIELSNTKSSNLKFFDPIKEHLSWNPIVSTDEAGKAGWQNLLEVFKTDDKCQTSSLQTRTEEPTQSHKDEEPKIPLVSTEKSFAPLEVLNRVRSLLDLW